MANEPNIVVDITRLITRFSRRTPNGIDRVDVEFAKRFFAMGRDQSAGVIWTPFGAPRLGRRPSLAIVESLLSHWREPRTSEARSPTRPDAAHLAQARANARQNAEPSARPGGRSIYVNVSTFPIWNPLYVRWLRRQTDWKPVFFVHDLIALTHPEYFPAAELPRHRARLETVAAMAAGVIVASRTVQADLAAHFRRQGWTLPPVCVAPLGLSAVFHDRPRAKIPAAERPLFVVCGTIEPRKNHWMLLNVWRELIRADASRAPVLVIVGRRGWESQNAQALMDRSRELRPHVRAAPDLSTVELSDLLDQASGLLMPSFAEGFGLPIHEALARGVPVIASDLPAFREINSPLLRLVGPIDGLRWAAEIANLCALATNGAKNPRPAAGDASWGRHFNLVDEFLATL